MTATATRPRDAAPTTAPRRTPGASSPPLQAGIVAAIGLAAWTLGIAVAAGADGARGSIFGVLFPLWHLGTWYALPYVLFGIVGVAAVMLAARPAARPAAAGALIGSAAAAYLMSLTGLAELLSFDLLGVAAYTLLTLGATLVAGGGMLLYARAEPRAPLAYERPTGLPLALALIAAGASVALVVSAALPVWPDRPLALAGAYRWLALEPVGVGLVGLGLIGAGLGGFNRAATAAALAGLGGLEALSSAATVAQTGAGASSPHSGAWVALAASLAIAAAGVLGALTARRRGAVEPEGATAAAEVNEPTRLLAAAAHLDPAFASRAVRDVLRERHRALAPSAGVALGDVLRHCVAARGRRQARNLLLAALAAPLLIALANRGHGAAVAAIVIALSWAIVLVELWTARYRVAARQLAAAGSQAAPSELAPGAEAAIRELERAETRNLVVYSGYRPWVGSGAVQGGWAFAVNVHKGRQLPGGGRMEPRGFTEDELHEHVASRLLATGLPTLRLADRVYVDGEHVRDDRRFLEDRFGRPRTLLTPAELEAAGAEGPPEAVRRVRSASVAAWGGEVTFTAFLDFRLEGISLYADTTYCALTPPHPWYRHVDSIDPHPTLGARVRLALEAAKATVLLPLAALRAARELPRAWRAWRRRSRERREIARNPRFDYGATTSLRELAQGPGYRRHFQWIDRDMFAKILERELLDAIVTFLDDHDIDTTDFEERQAALLNNGVIVTGGALNAQSLAVGAQSRSGVVGRVREAAKGAS